MCQRSRSSLCLFCSFKTSLTVQALIGVSHAGHSFPIYTHRYNKYVLTYLVIKYIQQRYKTQSKEDMASHQTERELFIKRIQQDNIAQRLTSSLHKLNQPEQRLNISRVSTNSNRTMNPNQINKSTSIYHSTVKIQIKSPSKTQLLKQIAQKLYFQKESCSTPTNHNFTSVNIIQSDKKSKNQIVSSKSKMNKLEQMLKDIKKCNQLSTKVVYSIKKNKHQKKQELSQDKMAFSNIKREESNKPQQSMNDKNLNKLFSELLSVRQELNKIKHQNKILLQLVKETNSSTLNHHPCPYCHK